ncbi:DUF6398 domain-containing protein [Parasediminibacterium sp. JCM 36343]|uniref:DUF6398 domain-containing protein n=1 Tax=Parasediminibacterium sp. JCM 36343 TaxID=3374279 RepID=UPI00397E5B85
MDKQDLKDKQQQILDLVKEFCSNHLNDEYYELSDRLVKKLGRKRNPPFITGQPQIWAAAVIHALGTINFLFDKSSEPYASIDDLNDFFGTKKSTTSGKSKIIRDLLKLRTWDKEFSTKHMSENNPFANLVMFNGLIVPIDALPEPYQQAAKLARAQGLAVSFGTQ